MTIEKVCNLIKQNGSSVDLQYQLDMLSVAALTDAIPNDGYSRTLLHYAVSWDDQYASCIGNIDSLKTIIAHAKNKLTDIQFKYFLEKKDNQDFTPLQRAADVGFSPFGHEILILAGADLLAPEKNGNSWLHLIAFNGFAGIIYHALNNMQTHVNPCIARRNNDNLTPYGEAIRQGYFGVADCLRNYIARDSTFNIDLDAEKRNARKLQTSRLRLQKQAASKAFTNTYCSFKSLLSLLLALISSVLSIVGDINENSSTTAKTVDGISMVVLAMVCLLEIHSACEQQQALVSIKREKLSMPKLFNGKHQCNGFGFEWPTWQQLTDSRPSIWPTVFFGILALILSGTGLGLKYADKSKITKSFLNGLSPLLLETLASQNTARLEAEVKYYEESLPKP